MVPSLAGGDARRMSPVAVSHRLLKEVSIMANKTLFQSLRGKLLPKADAVNEAGGIAYRLSPKHALAQYAATGCLSSTFYASADEQLATVLALCETIEPEFIARTAL